MAQIVVFLFTFFFLQGCTNDGDSSAINNIYTASASTQSECAASKVTHVTSPMSKPMLVVLINYSNVQISSNLSTWASKIFGKNQDELNDYYAEISQDQFEFSEATECNGIASVTLQKIHPDVDINSADFITSVYPDLALALRSLEDKISFDLYDTDGDGYISKEELLITFIIAGYEDAYEGHHVTNGIWAHQSCINSSIAPLVDGVSMMNCSGNGNFALFGEKHDISAPHNATIGIIAHELGHSAFSLPDLYLGGGIGAFGLMGAGTWAYADNTQFPGESPSHMSAWSKIYNGWVTADEGTGTKTLNSTSLPTYNVVKVQNGSTYFLLENRDNTGYDSGLFFLNGDFVGGLAIWEIDDTKTSEIYINSNSVNADTYNKGVSIVDAQGGYVSGGARGNADALFYDGNINFYETNISNISVPGPAMTLDIN